ncbi:MAG: hypothetical protein C5B58_09595 [Acidobacteria bacterium]|nr:MAG: hypothetical protein C5B58_09595 [Acidobacteriota bacterium]
MNPIRNRGRNDDRISAYDPLRTKILVTMKALFSIILAFAISIATVEAGAVRTAKNVVKSTANTAKNVAHSVVKGTRKAVHTVVDTLTP